MKEHPIMYSSSMVKAILEGHKTQTRRVITSQNSLIGPGGDWSKLCWDGQAVYLDQGIEEWAPLPFVDGQPETGQYLHVAYDWESDRTIFRIYPRWEVGDRLWVKETAWLDQSGGIWGYKADGIEWPPSNCGGKALPAIFMPLWASRITQEITAIRAQRIQDIVVGDCIAEGIQNRYRFRDLWDSLNAKRGYGWDKNPWVWIYTTTRI